MGYEGLEFVVIGGFMIVMICVLSLAWLLYRDHQEREETYVMLDVV
jgi:hypothetical protein